MAAFGEESRPDRLTATKTLARRLAYPAIVEATLTPYFKVFLDHEDKMPANENLPEFGRAVTFGVTSATELLSRVSR